MIENVFVRLSLRGSGQVIGTTHEHPFYCYNEATGEGEWKAANVLSAGDYVLTESGEWKQVEEVLDTGETATVYNFRVADWHTYFVGDVGWGFAVWAHNADYSRELDRDPSNARASLRDALATNSATNRAHHIILFEAQTPPFVQAAARAGFNINGKRNGINLPLPVHPQGGRHPRYNGSILNVLTKAGQTPMSDVLAARYLEKLADQVGRRLAARFNRLP